MILLNVNHAVTLMQQNWGLRWTTISEKPTYL